MIHWRTVKHRSVEPDHNGATIGAVHHIVLAGLHRVNISCYPVEFEMWHRPSALLFSVP
jgi:hypothetical protein